MNLLFWDSYILFGTGNNNTIKRKIHILTSFVCNDNPAMQPKSVNRIVLIIFITTVLSLISIYSFATDYYAVADGNWNNSATWSNVDCLSPGGDGVPGAADNVTICNGITVTENVAVAQCNNLTVYGTLNYAAANTLTVNGNLVMSGGTINGSATGTLNVTGTFTSATSTSHTIGRCTMNVTGATTIDGTMTLSSNTGVKTFRSSVTINSGAVWTSTTVTTTGNLIFRNGITNNGTSFSAGGATFNTNSQSLSGSTDLNFANVVTVTGVTVTNNETVSITNTGAGALAGNGNWTQGINSTLNYSGSTITITTIDATADPNTVEYNSGVAQTARGTTYHNLIVSNAGTTTMNAATTVNGDITINGGTLADGGFQFTGNATGSLTMAAGTAFTLGTAATATAFPSDYTSANISLNTTSTVNYNSNQVQTISSVPAYGNLTLTATAAITKTPDGDITVNGNLANGANNTIADAGNTITVKGNVTNTGTHSGAGKIYLNAGSSSHTLSGTGGYSNVELDDTQNASLSANTTINGNLTITNGTFTIGAYNITVSGATTIYGTLSITSTTGTKIFNDVTVNGIWSNSANEAVTINGNLTNNGTYTAGTGVYTLAGTGKIISGSAASTTFTTLTVTGSYTNNSTVYVTTLNGAGTWTQGNSSYLYIAGNATVTTFYAGTNVNTVDYTSAGAQTINGGIYWHLTNSNAGTSTLGGAVTVNGNLLISGGTLATSNFQITGNATGTFTMSAGTALTLGLTTGATAVNFPSNYTSGNISLDPTSTVTYQTNGAQNVSVVPTYGNLTITTGAAASTKSLTGTPCFIAGNLTLSVAAATFDIAANTVNLTGNISGAAALSMSAGTLNISGNNTQTGTFTPGTGTVNYQGNLNPQTIRGTTYYDLTVNKTVGITANMAAATTINNNFTITSGIVTSTNTITVTGATNISGTLNMNATGTKTFGDIVINAGGLWNVTAAEAFTINGSIQNDGTCTANTGTYTLAGAGKTINGASSLTFTTITVTGSYSNNTTITVTTLNGAGSWIQGTGSYLTIGGSASVTTFDAGTNVNTVEYNSAAAQTINSGTYWHLINSNAGTSTLGGAITVNGNLSVTGGTLASSTYQITGNATGTYTMNAGTVLTLGLTTDITSVNFPINFIAGNISLDATSTVTYQTNADQNISTIPAYGNLTLTTGAAVSNKALSGIPLYIAGNLTINANATLDAATNTINLTGNLTGAGGLSFSSGVLNIYGNNTQTGAFTDGTSTVNYLGSLNPQTIRGTTYYDLTANKTAGTTANMAAATIIDDNFTISSGIITSANTISVSGTTSISGTLNMNATGTKTFEDIIINTGGTWNVTAAEAFTINGNIQNDGTFTANTGTYTLTGAGNTISGINSLTFTTLSVTGSYTNSNDVSVTVTTLNGAGQFTQDNNSYLYISGSSSVTTFDAGTNINTVEYNGAGAQTVNGGTYYDLIINKSANTASSGGAVIVNDYLNIIAGTFNPAGQNLTVNGTTDISGIFSDGTLAGTDIFSGKVTVNASGSWASTTVTASANIVFQDGITNNGTSFAAGGATFDTNDQIIDGSTLLSFANNVVITGINLTNNNTVTMSSIAAGTLSGTGTWIQGVSSYLNYFGSTITIAALNASASGNTIDYIRNNGAQTIFNPSGDIYYNLTISNTSGVAQTKTLTANADVNGNLTISGMAVLSVSTFDITVAGDWNNSSTAADPFTQGTRTVTFDGTTAQNITNTGNANGTVFNNVTISNTSVNGVTLAAPITVNSTFTLNSGLLNTDATNLLTLIDNATSTSGTSSSYVNGPMKKTGNDAFVFPVGKGGYWARIGITAPATATTQFTAEYFNAPYSSLTPVTSPLNDVSTIEYWTLNRAVTADNVNVSLFWEDNIRSTIILPNTAQLVVARWTGTDWVSEGQSGISSGPAGNVSSNSASTFGTFTFGDVGGALPVELINFTAEADNDAVLLKWETASELNNDYFTIEKSKDANNFESVKFIDGAGNSNEVLQYNAYDNEPSEGISYYRLKQTDYDGKYSYSETISINFENKTNGTVLVFPSPSSDNNIHLTFNSNKDDVVLLNIYSMTGSCIMHKTIHAEIGNNTISLNISGFAKGKYLIHISGSDRIITSDFIKY